jgi:hypothetical protein
MKTDNFKAAGDFERERMTQLFHQFGVINYEFTNSEGYDRIEGYYTGKTGSEYVFEVKCRSLTTSAYTHTIIEKSKIEAVVNESKKTNHQPILFFFFEDKKCFYQPLHSDVFYSSYWESAPITTMGYKRYIQKEFVPFFLDPKKTIKLNYETRKQ